MTIVFIHWRVEQERRPGRWDCRSVFVEDGDDVSANDGPGEYVIRYLDEIKAEGKPARLVKDVCTETNGNDRRTQEIVT